MHQLDGFSQNQKIADSLKSIYQADQLKGDAKLELLRSLSFNEINDYTLSLKYAEELISLAEAETNYSFLHSGYLQKGYANLMLGNLEIALRAYFKSSEAAVNANYTAGQGMAYVSIADTYSELGDSNNAELYYDKAIVLLRDTEDAITLATALLNAGDEAFNSEKYDKALQYFEESGLLFDDVNYRIGTAYNKGNIGMVYAEQGKHDLALENINEAIIILEELEDYSPISEYLTYMADIYMQQANWPTALSYSMQSLDLAKKYRLKAQISEAYLQISNLYELRGMTEESFKNYKNHIIYRDSLANLTAIQEMANLRTDFEVSQKQIEVDLLDEQKKNQQLISFLIGIGLLAVLIMAVGLFRRNKFIEKSRALIEMEKNRSDLLLLNILPEETATELKDKGKVKAKRFESVSVMFTDFKGFTAYSDKLSPEELVDSIDFYYSRFDEIVEKHGLEKIKTVGDAYMCAGGLPDPDPDNAYKMVEAAIEIAEFVKESKKNDPDDMTRFDIRIGINTGPVVAGVVGKKKFAYDIWGDTVNIASRMESNSEPGKVNISDNTFQIIKDRYECSYRGEIDAKNKGMMKMYFVEQAIEKEKT